MAGPALSCRSQLENSLPVLLATASQTPQAQEQNGILEWLRKLRLHKYYPVFKQLTMEKFLSLTEEDLNKFESLTMGAKKKLKTQLELEKEKSEKRTVNPADSSSSSSSSVSTGVARVPPTTHVAPIQSIRSSHAADLRVEVDPPPPPDPPQEGSSSEYSGPASSSSSSSSSPMGIQTPREESSDSAEESERRLEAPLGSPEKEKPVPVLSHFSPASARPTAQVLPSVQNEASSGPAAHPPPVPVQLVTAAAGSPHVTPMRILNAMHKSERGTPELRLLPSSSSSSSSVQSLLTLEEKAKYSPLGGPSRSSLKMEKSFGGPVPEGPILASHQTTPNHHHPPPAAAAAAPAAVVNFGPRAKMVHPSTLDRMAKGQAQPGGMVEPSPVATSSALFHVARPPIKLLVSSPLPTEAALGGPSASSNSMQFSLPPALISPRTALYSANTKVAFSALSGSSGSGGGSLPVGSPLPGGGGGFCVNGNAASPTTTTSTPPFANLNHGPQPCPAPSQSPPSLSPTTENGFYPSGTSSSSQNHHHHHHHHHHPQQPPGCLVCSSCGCSGNCGSGGVTVGYGNYFQPTFSGPSVLTFPFLPFSPLCGGNSYLNTQQYNGGNGGGAFPMVHAPYGQSAAMAADSLLSGQSAFGVPPLQSFLAGTAGVYQASAMLGGAGSGGGGGHKKNGNLSCYNCGASGHRAQDCKQPPMDFNRQGTFRLKYAPPAESLDSTD